MNLNISKLSKTIEESDFTKIEIASKCGIDRKTIENVLAGRDPKLSTIVSLSSFLGLKISYLFDEEVEIRYAGRDYVEDGKTYIKGRNTIRLSQSQATKNENLKKRMQTCASNSSTLKRKL